MTRAPRFSLGMDLFQNGALFLVRFAPFYPINGSTTVHFFRDPSIPFGETIVFCWLLRAVVLARAHPARLL